MNLLLEDCLPKLAQGIQKIRVEHANIGCALFLNNKVSTQIISCFPNDSQLYVPKKLMKWAKSIAANNSFNVNEFAPTNPVMTVVFLNMSSDKGVVAMDLPAKNWQTGIELSQNCWPMILLATHKVVELIETQLGHVDAWQLSKDVIMLVKERAGHLTPVHMLPSLTTENPTSESRKKPNLKQRKRTIRFQDEAPPPDSSVEAYDPSDPIIQKSEIAQRMFIVTTSCDTRYLPSAGVDQYFTQKATYHSMGLGRSVLHSILANLHGQDIHYSICLETAILNQQIFPLVAGQRVSQAQAICHTYDVIGQYAFSQMSSGYGFPTMTQALSSIFPWIRDNSYVRQWVNAFQITSNFINSVLDVMPVGDWIRKNLY